MMLSSKPVSAKRSFSERRSQPGPRRFLIVAQAQQAKQQQQATATRRNLLSAALGVLGGLAAADAAKAADAYEELRSITASRTGSTSLLESFEKTKGALSGSKADRGIRDRLAAEASNAPKPAAPSGGNGFKLPAFGGSSSGSPAPRLSAPKPPAPRPSLAAGPKPAAPKPAAPKPAAPAAAAGSGAPGAFGPLLQAAAVLGFVGVGANVVTNAATNKKPKAAVAAAAPAPAAPALAAAPSRGTAVIAEAAKQPAGGSQKAAVVKKPAGGSQKAVVGSKKVTTKAPLKGTAAAAAASGGSIKLAVKQALVNEESPEEPTDFAVAGFLGFAALLAAFFLFGLPKPIPSGPSEFSSISDPLVLAAKEAAASKASSYSSAPLFKSLDEAAEAPSKAVIIAAPAAKAPSVFAAPPAPAPAPAPAAPAPAAPAPAAAPAAPKPAPAPAPAPAAPAPAPVRKAEVPAPAAPAAASDAEAAGGPSPLVLAAGGVAVVIGAFALVGSSGETSAEGSAAAGATPAAAAPAAPAAADAAAASPAAAAAEAVSAAAASAGAAAVVSEEPKADNAAYEKAVNALMADPDTTDELFAIIAPHLRNGPALAWALVSNSTNAETLDGWAFQKLSKAKYARVRELLLSMGLQLPESPKPQFNMSLLAEEPSSSSSSSSDLDPERLRSVFEALLQDPNSRTLMRRLLAGAGMPFNEEAFEEQVKDSTYFNLAIAPILRKMPQQKLAVLADLQDPVKLQELVASVSTLAADERQLEAVTSELSSDVRQTVEKIKDKGTTGASS